MISPTDTIYPILTENISIHELSSCFLVNEEEIKFIENETRQPSAKLGLLLMLKIFQKLGYFVPTKSIPEKIQAFVSSQLNIEEPSPLLKEYANSSNRFIHLNKILGSPKPLML